MSTKITQVYDALVSKVTTLLPNHLRLSDAYFLTRCTDSEKRQGVGIKVGPGLNTTEQISCDIILSQEISIIITRMTQARELEISKKDDADKQLLEDFFIILKDFEKEPTLNTDVILGSTFSGHNGIQSMKGESDGFLYIEGSFTFKYLEHLN